MKSGLQRIEATLNQLDTLPEPEAEPRAARSAVQSPISPDVQSAAQSSVQLAVRFGDRPATQPVAQPVAPIPLELPFGGKLPPVPKDGSAVAPSAQAIAPQVAQPISPSLAPVAGAKAAIAPDLPGFPFTPLAATRHATDPALALGILREIEGTLLSWQRELQRLQLEIQELHMEGPIIDGWLESQPTTPPPPETEFIRHAEIDALMGYVNTICDTAPEGMIQDTPRAGYRLCGLDADGKVWSRDCPPERVPQVSLAIARCQKVRQLVTRKNDLESRLSKLAEHLVSVHSELMT
jgi:hypothetical protein